MLKAAVAPILHHLSITQCPFVKQLVCIIVDEIY